MAAKKKVKKKKKSARKVVKRTARKAVAKRPAPRPRARRAAAPVRAPGRPARRAMGMAGDGGMAPPSCASPGPIVDPPGGIIQVAPGSQVSFCVRWCNTTGGTTLELNGAPHPVADNGCVDIVGLTPGVNRLQ